MPRKPVGNRFEERIASLPIFGEGRGRGELVDAAAGGDRPRLFYRHPAGELHVGDSLRWLESVEPGSVDLCFADPPYNLGKSEWDSFESQDAYIEWSRSWIELAARALKPTGTLYVCGFSEVLADLRRPAAAHFHSCRWLVWSYRNKANLGRGWGRSHESILWLRKGKEFTFNTDPVRIPYGRHTTRYPDHPQAESSNFSRGKGGKEGGKGWRPHPDGAKPRDVFELPITSNGMSEKTPHPTQKPEELLRRFVLASSDADELVIDPFVGSGTTLVCAAQLGRRFAGCELDEDYARWAVARLEETPERSIDEWIQLDRDTEARRRSIR